ncbi:MAG: hypothetical protein AB7F43_03630 [Bacteriovoracia bacterium]
MYFEFVTSDEKGVEDLKKNQKVTDAVLLSRELGSAGGADRETGLAAISKIRSVSAQIPIILLSRYWDKPQFQSHQSSPNGLDGYYNKKQSFDVLENLIAELTKKPFSQGAIKPAPSVSGGMSIDVKLQAVEDVVKTDPNKISMEVPIDLGFEELDEAPQATTPQELDVSGISISQSIKEISVESEPIPISADSQGIDISKIEVSQVDGQLALEVSEIKPVGTINVEGSKEEKVLTEPKPEMEMTIEPSVELPQAKPESQTKSIFARKYKGPTEVSSIFKKKLKVEIKKTLPEPENSEAEKELPYLFKEETNHTSNFKLDVSGIPEPVVPVSTGTPLSNDTETLKQYLTMREQDVAILTMQLKYAKDSLMKSEEQVHRLTTERDDYIHQISDLKNKISHFELERNSIAKNLDGEMEQLRVEVKTKIDRIKLLEDKLVDAAEQNEKLKERVRSDIRKIRLREKELENKLEILRRDSETLIQSRENKILELKRKIDLLEYNYDALQDKNSQEKQNISHLNEKMKEVLKALRLASGLIEADEDIESKLKNKRAS